MGFKRNQHKGEKMTAEQWLLLARDLVLLLCLILTFLALDATTKIWLRWWPLPLAMASILLTVAAGGGRFRITMIELAAWLGLGALAVWRVLALKNGPIPLTGVLEAQDLALTLAAASAVWCAARCQPLRVAMVLVGAGLIALVTASLIPSPLGVGERSTFGLFFGLFTFHPAVWMNPLLVCAQLNMVFAMLFAGGAMYVHRHGRNARSGLWAGLLGATGLAGGALAGFIMARTQMRLGLEFSLPLMHGMRAIEDLWAQSALTGWGHRPLPQLIGVMAGPREYLMPVWCGPVGGLAVGGVAGGALMVLGAALLLGRSQGGAGDEPLGRYARRWAVIPALTLLGLIAVGGVIPTAAWYFAVMWAAVAMGGGAPAGKPAAWRRWAEVAGGGLWMGGLTTAAVWFGLLGWGSAMARSMEIPPQDEDAYRSRLNRAARLNPYDPGIAVYAAMSWQRSMTAERAWNERSFGYVLMNWDRAIKLHPYDTRLVMHKAEFLMKCERFNSVVETIEEGLERRPNASELLEWLYLASRRAGRSELAYRTMDRGLRLDPSQPQWWHWRWEQAGQLGQGPLTSQSMAAALSRDPEQPALIAASWRKKYLSQHMADVPTVPGAMPLELNPEIDSESNPDFNPEMMNN